MSIECRLRGPVRKGGSVVARTELETVTPGTKEMHISSTFLTNQLDNDDGLVACDIMSVKLVNIGTTGYALLVRSLLNEQSAISIQYSLNEGPAELDEQLTTEAVALHTGDRLIVTFGSYCAIIPVDLHRCVHDENGLHVFPLESGAAGRSSLAKRPRDDPDDGGECPSCDGTLQLREVKRTGHILWGCSNFKYPVKDGEFSCGYVDNNPSDAVKQIFRARQ